MVLLHEITLDIVNLSENYWITLALCDASHINCVVAFKGID